SKMKNMISDSMIVSMWGRLFTGLPMYTRSRRPINNRPQVNNLPHMATVALALMAIPAWGQTMPRTRDGKPDLQGYWATRVFFSAFDLEEHKEAAFGVPAGKGVVVDPPDGKIPYQSWALAKKKDLVEHHLYEDPQAHCILSGVPRQMYTP